MIFSIKVSFVLNMFFKKTKQKRRKFEQVQVQEQK